jgi:hypothetical protein
MVVAILSVGIGIALVVTGSRWGIGIALAGGATIPVCLFVQAAAPVLPWIVAGLGAVGVAYVAYTLFVHKRAAKDLVETVGVVRNALPADTEARLFGKGPVTEVQRPTTEALVKVIKSRPAATGV